MHNTSRRTAPKSIRSRPPSVKFSFDPRTGGDWAPAPRAFAGPVGEVTRTVQILTATGSRPQTLTLRTRERMTGAKLAALYGFTPCEVL